jgi:hypothetical protein
MDSTNHARVYWPRLVELKEYEYAPQCYTGNGRIKKKPNLGQSTVFIRDIDR